MNVLLCCAIICTVLGVIARLYASHIFAPRVSTVTATVLYTAGHLLLCVLPPVGSAVFHPVLLAAVSLLLLPVCFRCGILKAAIHAALLCFLMAVAQGLASVLLASFSEQLTASAASPILLSARAVISVPLYFWSATVASRFFKLDAAESTPGAILLLSILPLATEIIGIAFIYVSCSAQLQPEAEWMTVICLLALLVVDLLVLVIYSSVQRMAQETTLQQLAAQKDKDDMRLYQALQQQHKSQRILIHDIRRHTQMVETMLLEDRQDQALEYLRSLNTHPGIQNDKVFCQNGTLNIILAQHHSRCRASGVQLHTDIRDSCIDGMDAVSITALFGNLLTNACEAAEKTARKYIELAVVPQQTGGVLITVENSCDRPPRTDEKGLFVTQKRDKAVHGVGLSSIVQVVNKYGGTLRMYYDADERAVHTVIGIPSIRR